MGPGICCSHILPAATNCNIHTFIFAACIMLWKALSSAWSHLILRASVKKAGLDYHSYLSDWKTEAQTLGPWHQKRKAEAGLVQCSHREWMVRRWKGPWNWSQKAQAWVLALLLTSCLTSGKSFSPSQSWFPICQILGWCFPSRTLVTTTGDGIEQRILWAVKLCSSVQGWPLLVVGSGMLSSASPGSQEQ